MVGMVVCLTHLGMHSVPGRMHLLTAPRSQRGSRRVRRISGRRDKLPNESTSYYAVPRLPPRGMMSMIKSIKP